MLKHSQLKNTAVNVYVTHLLLKIKI